MVTIAKKALAVVVAVLGILALALGWKRRVAARTAGQILAQQRELDAAQAERKNQNERRLADIERDLSNINNTAATLTASQAEIEARRRGWIQD